MDPSTLRRAEILRDKRFRRVVIVTGDRHTYDAEWKELLYYQFTLLRYHSHNGEVETFAPTEVLIIHGDCRGVDRMADSVAEFNGYERLPAPYPDGMGRRGGPYRNRWMLGELLSFRDRGALVSVQAYHPNIAVSKGTKDMMDQAHHAGVPVRLWQAKHGDLRGKPWPL